MKRLLNQSEKRQLLAIEILYERKDWMTLSELSKMLDCSVRVLKDDVAYFKNNFKELTIESSNHGVRLVMYNNTGLKTIYQHTLRHSTAYNLLEYVFMKKEITVADLKDLLFISSSTVYRLIDQINGVIEELDFRIETSPCKIVGSENQIRYFFYNYFHEKYSNLQWPYENIDEQGLDKFLQFFIEFSHIEVDFAYYNIFKTVSAINLVRYKQGYFINTSDIQTNFDEIIPNLTIFQETFRYFEEKNRVEVSDELIQQVFTPYIREEFSLNYERLIEKTKTNQTIAVEVDFLNDLLDDLSKKHQLCLNNKESVIYNLHNAAHLEYYESRSGYILHNQNREFTNKIKSEFPNFYDSLYQAAKSYRELLNKPITDDGISFIMYILFTTWENLLPELRRKYEKIHILVVSDQHISHSRTIKNIIDYEFHEQIIVDVYDSMALDYSILENLEYDIIIANFPLPTLENRHTVYVENLPTFTDIANVREAVDHIIRERIS